MKIVLSLSVVALISLGSFLGNFSQVDYTGKYWPKQGDLKVGSSLLLKDDGSFDYSIFYLEDIVYATKKINGEYIVTGNELKLIPRSFESTSNHFDTRDFRKMSGIKIRNNIEGLITAQSSPALFKNQLTAFESGTLQLKPKYFIKQIKQKISLCQMDLKTEKYIPTLVHE